MLAKIGTLNGINKFYASYHSTTWTGTQGSARVGWCGGPIAEIGPPPVGVVFYVLEGIAMPQPLQKGYTLEYRPRIVLERPTHAAGIALVTSEWAALEDQLILLFRFALFGFELVR